MYLIVQSLSKCYGIDLPMKAKLITPISPALRRQAEKELAPHWSTLPNPTPSTLANAKTVRRGLNNLVNLKLAVQIAQKEELTGRLQKIKERKKRLAEEARLQAQRIALEE